MSCLSSKNLLIELFYLMTFFLLANIHAKWALMLHHSAPFLKQLNWKGRKNPVLNLKSLIRKRMPNKILNEITILTKFSENIWIKFYLAIVTNILHEFKLFYVSQKFKFIQKMGKKLTNKATANNDNVSMWPKCVPLCYVPISVTRWR